MAEINGDAGDNVLVGTGVADTIDGQGGNDTISGEGGNDTLIGGDGDDTISGGADNDTASGGTGNDTLNGDDGDDILNGGDGNNSLSGGLGMDVLIAGSGTDMLDGGDGNDDLNAGEGSDTLNGGLGDDVIRGGLGADIMTGGAGIDRYVFGFGIPRSESSPSTVDVITDFEGAGVAGGDIIDLPALAGSLPLVFSIAAQSFNVLATGIQLPAEFVGDGLADVSWQYNAAQNRVEIWADANDDGQMSEVDIVIYLNGVTSLIQSDLADNFLVWRGTGGNDVYQGNASANIAYGIVGDNTLNGAGGNDTLYGAQGADTLNGDAGNDQLRGGADNDVLNGGDDADNLDGEAGDDQLNGGFGADYITDVLGNNVINGGADNDYIQVTNGNNTADGGDGNDTLQFAGLQDGNGVFLHSSTAMGGAGNDTIDFYILNGSMSGGDGNDILRVREGTVSMDGGAGDDFLQLGDSYFGTISDRVQTATGGAGADIFRVNNRSRLSDTDIITDFNAGEGDRIQLKDVSAGRTGGGGLWPLTSTSLIFRGAMDPSLLVEGASLPGGDLGTGFVQFWTTQVGGNTFLVGDIDGDLILDATDMVIRFDGLVTLTTASFEAGTFVAVAGTTGADTLTGTALADQIYALGGNDSIDGLEGADALYGGAGDDVIGGGIGADTIFGEAGGDTLNGGVDNDLLYGGDGIDTLNGDAGNDQLRGGVGNDTLNGGDDADSLDGEAGDDVLNGGFGADFIGESLGNNVANGGADNDYIQLGNGNNIADGGDGNDTIQLSGSQDGNGVFLHSSTAMGGAGNDTIDFYILNGSMSGGDGNDILRVREGTVSMDGGAGDDFLQLGDSYFGTISDRVQTATGGAGADIFRVNNRSRLSDTDIITDFNAGEGDRIQLKDVSAGRTGGGGLWPLTSTSLIFRGAMDPSLLVEGASLPGGDLGTGFVQFWTTQVGGNTFLVGDIDGDLILDATDMVIRFDGLVTLTTASFEAGTFVAVAGTTGADTLTGTALADQIYALGGNDSIDGLEGADALYGGAGDDVIGGGIGADTIFGEAGGDTLNGGVDNDLLYGGDGIDTLNGDAGNDQLCGGVGNDTLNGGDDADSLDGEAGDDVLNGGFGADFIGESLGNNVANGGADNDYIQLGNGNNIADGGDGNDTIQLSGSQDGNGVFLHSSTAMGGAGNDTIDFYILNGSMSGGDGNDILRVREGTVSMDGGAGDDFLQLGDSYFGTISDRVQTATGGAGADIFRVNNRSRLSDTDIITDFNAGEGDRIQLKDVSAGRTGGGGFWPLTSTSLIFRGAMDPSLLVEGATLPGGDLGTGFVQFWTTQVGGNTFLVGDIDGDLILDATDMVIRFDGLVTLTTASFEAGTFVAVAGTTGADTLTGTALADQIYALGGNDSIDGLEGADALYGGAGDDVIGGGIGADTIFGEAGGDTLNGGVDNDLLYGGDGIDTLNGDAGNDQLRGGADNDVLNGGDDADSLDGEAGDDVLNGGFGADYIGESLGNNVANGGADNDYIQLGNGNNIADGGDGNDTIQLSGSQDGNGVFLHSSTAMGGAGNDTIDFYILNGSMSGGDGNDILRVREGTVSMDGGAGDDFLQLGDSYFGTVSDRVQTATGGAGADIFRVNNRSRLSDTDIITDFNAGEGDRIQLKDVSAGRTGGGGFWPLTSTSLIFRGAMDPSLLVEGATLPGGDLGTGFVQFWTTQVGGNTFLVGDIDGDLILDATDMVIRFDGLVTLTTASFVAGSFASLGGGIGSDTITGGETRDFIFGEAGDDVLTGNGGDDLLDGGVGADVMSGGSGNDIYYVDNAGDQVIEDIFMKELGAEPLGGNDLVYASVSYVLATNVEQLVLTGSGNLNGTGNALANQITGNAGNNRIDGGAGNDVLAGGLGNDTYVVDSSSDVVTEGAAAGIDLVEASASFVLGDNLENLTLTGAGNIDGTGNAIGNRILGNSGNNVLNGAAGADVLQGGAGNDSYIVDNASDRVVETLSLTVGDTNDAGGIDTVFASVSYSLDTASNIRFVENLTLTGAANINATGNALANVITGNSGNNTLDGGAGNDTMAGGAGNDIYLVDAAGDVVTEGASAGTDTVRASVSYTLAAHVENLQLQGVGNINGIGNGEANSLTGTSGNNRLEGMGGNDVIDGGLGADTMLGGAGDDSYVIDNGSDRVFETVTNNAADTNDAGGIDTVSTSITINMNGYNGIRYVERAILTGTASIGITGNALNNHITGNSGNNSIDGGEGADTMIGGRGNDIYTVDNIGDVVTEVVGQGFDTVRASIDYTLGSDVEDLVLTGSANLTGTGNGLANRLTGNAGNNILDGGGGTDTLIGGAGNDTYIFDNPGDRAFETVTATATDTNDAGGIDQILSSFTVYLAQSNGMKFIENVTLTGTAAAAVYGNDLGNAITANSGANYLDGANGNDIILGMGGNDTMLGGAGADTLDGGAGRDRLTGGAGQDILTGGSEADTFVFATGDIGTSQGTADRITDWSGLAGGQGDRIDLSAIDANSANGSGTNEAFTFIGSGGFTNVAGQLRSEIIGGNTYLMADTNGDGVADLWLQLDGTVTIGAGDLAL